MRTEDAHEGRRDGRLETRVVGSGPPVVLVHGSVTGGESTWRRQLPLAERWRLVIPDRPGFGRAPFHGQVDFEHDGALVADLLESLGSAHVVGHSYGGLVALIAAARRPRSVRSLVVVEPPAFSVVRDNPIVETFRQLFVDHLRIGPLDTESFLRGFVALAGATLPTPLPTELKAGARLLRNERHPWEADLRLDVIRDLRVPALVVSGGHHPAYEAICDAVADGLAGERVVLPGGGHTVQRIGEQFNDVLEHFLSETERGGGRE